MFKAIAAYGRSYPSQLDAMIDWQEGKDFLLETGQYFSIRDFKMLREEAIVDRIFSASNYVLEIRFNYVSDGEHLGVSRFYVDFDGKCCFS